MKARPSFTVDIKKGDKVLAFACSFLPPEEGSKDSSKILIRYHLKFIFAFQI
jgi:hypothetical protein